MKQIENYNVPHFTISSYGINSLKLGFSLSLFYLVIVLEIVKFLLWNARGFVALGRLTAPSTARDTQTTPTGARETSPISRKENSNGGLISGLSLTNNT